MTGPTAITDFDALLCPGTRPQLIGHHHVCTRTAGHRGRRECTCGAQVEPEQMGLTAEETP